MTPQLRQAIHLLQLSTAELEAELAEAVESNPLLDWTEEHSIAPDAAEIPSPNDAGPAEAASTRDDDDWGLPDGETWYERTGPADPDEDSPAAEQVAAGETLHDHLFWQLHLSPLSPRGSNRPGRTMHAFCPEGPTFPATLPFKRLPGSARNSGPATPGFRACVRLTATPASFRGGCRRS